MKVVMFYNCINIIAWVALACFFGKWWIALFALLTTFRYNEKANQKHYRVCDGCGKHSPTVDPHNDAIEAAKKDGWYCTIVHYPDGTSKDRDYCPECREKGMI